MSRAVFIKTLRSALPLMVLATISIVLFEILMVRMVHEAITDLDLIRAWLDRPLIKMIVRLALGADLAGDLTPTTLASFFFVHPFMLAVAWTLILTLTSSVPAGEIGRGTADLLLTLPVSRVRVYVSTSLVWILACLPISAAPWVGLLLGQYVFPLDEPIEMYRLAPVSYNLLALHLSVCGLTTMFSGICSRRGTTVGIVLAILLASDLLNLVAQFWEVVRPISVLGFLYYYRPLPIVRAGAAPLDDMGVLVAVGGLAWLIGLWRFTRRDIPAT